MTGPSTEVFSPGSNKQTTGLMFGFLKISETNKVLITNDSSAYQFGKTKKLFSVKTLQKHKKLKL